MFELHHNIFFWRNNPSRRHLFWCWKLHLHYLRDRLWHSTSFWTWSPRWSATTPCASWVSGMPEKGSPLAVLWLLKTEDVLMKIDGLVIVYCYALTVTIVWVEHGSTSMESHSIWGRRGEPCERSGRRKDTTDRGQRFYQEVRRQTGWALALKRISLWYFDVQHLGIIYVPCAMNTFIHGLRLRLYSEIHLPWGLWLQMGQVDFCGNWLSCGTHRRCIRAAQTVSI